MNIFKKMPKYKIIPLLCASLIFVLGIILINISSNKQAQEQMSAIVGGTILVVGVIRLIYGVVLLVKIKERDSLYNIILGGVDIIFGIVFLVYINSKIVFLVLLSIYVLIAAILDCFISIMKSYDEIPWVGGLVVGLVKFILGVLIMFKPFGGFGLWLVFSGIYFMLQCASWVFFTLKVKAIKETGELTIE